MWESNFNLYSKKEDNHYILTCKFLLSLSSHTKKLGKQSSFKASYYDIMIFMKMKAEISFKLGIHTLYMWSPAYSINILQIVELT